MGRILIPYFLFFLLFPVAGFAQNNWVNGGGGAANDEALDISKDQNGNILSIGYFSQSATFGNTTLNAAGSGDIFITRQTASGVYNLVLRAGGQDSDRGSSICSDNSGNLFVTGTFKGTATFGNTTLTSNGLQDMFLAKISPAGNWLWVQQLGSVENDVAYGVACDSSGNVVFTGQFKETITIGTNTYTSMNSPSGMPSYDFVVAKFSPSGSLLWSKHGKAKYDDRVMSLSCDTQGNVVLCGQFSDTLEFDQTYPNNGLNLGFLIKLDSAGNNLWMKKMTALQIATYDVTTQGTDIFVTGDHKGTLAVIGSPSVFLPAAADYNAFVLKFNSGGNLIWKHNTGSDNLLSARGVAVDDNGEVWYSGHFNCSLTQFADQFGSGRFYSAGYRDVILIKLDVNGVRAEQRQYGGAGDDFACGVIIGTNNLPVIAGSYGSAFCIPGNQFDYFPGFYYRNNLNAYDNICGISNYGVYGTRLSSGLKDVFVAFPFNTTHPFFDYFTRSGVCGSDVVDGLINGLNDTVRGCGDLNLFVDNKTSNDGEFGPEYTYLWDSLSTGQFFHVYSSQWVNVEVATQDGCRSFNDSIYVEIYPLPPTPFITSSIGGILPAIPVMDCLNKLTLMDGDTTILTGSYVLPGYSSRWQTPNGTIYDTLSIPAYQNGVYTYEVVSPNGFCVSSYCVQIIPFSESTCEPGTMNPLLVFSNQVFENTDTVRICKGDFFEIKLVDSTLYAQGLPTYLAQFVHWQKTGGFSFVFPSSAPHSFYQHVQNFEANYSGNCVVHATVLDLHTNVPLFTISKSFYLDVHQPPPNNPMILVPGSLCPGDSAWISVVGGDNYSWSGPSIISYSQMHDSILISATGEYFVQSTTIDPVLGCSSVMMDGTSINEITRPIISMLPEDGVICPGDSVLLSADAGTAYEWYGPSGNIISTSQNCYAVVPGMYYYHYTNATGCDLISEFGEVIEYSTPFLEAQPGTHLCLVDSVVVTVQTNADSDILWGSPFNNASAVQTIDSAGIYTVGVEYCNVTTMLSITISDDITQVNLVATTDSICPGDTLALFAQGNFVSYHWGPDEGSSSILVISGPGDYFVEATDPNGCKDSDTIHIIGLSAVEPPLGIDTLVCSGISLALTTPSNMNLVWYNDPFADPVFIGDTLTIAMGSEPLIYFVAQDDGTCTSEPSAVQVGLLPGSIRPEIITDSLICAGSDLNIVADSVPGLNYAWTGPNGFVSSAISILISSADADDAGEYMLMVYDSVCSSIPDTVNIQVVITDLSSWNNQALNVCENDSLSVAGLNLSGTILWHNGTIANQTMVYPNDSVFFVYTDSLGCITYSDTISVNTLALPTLQVVTDTSVCENVPLTLLANSNAQIEWLDENGQQVSSANTLVIPPSGTDSEWIVVARDSMGCSSSDTVNVEIVFGPEAPILSGDTLFCEGSNILVTASAQSGLGLYWFFPNGSIISTSNLNIPNCNSSMAGVYWCTYSGSTCPGDTSSFDVNIEEFPHVDIIGNSAACFGDTVQMNAQSLSMVVWMNGTQGLGTNILADSSQWISASTTTTCGTATDSIFLVVNPLPVSMAGEDQLIYVGNETQLSGYGTGDYLWTPNIYLSCNTCPNPIVSPNATTNYVLSITDANGCVQTDTVTIHVEVYGTCYAPNGFTPNADGINDVFNVIVNDAAQVELNVFNRWGELIYSSDQMGLGWDGFYKGKLAPLGAYVWRVSGVYQNGDSFSFMGEITLVP